MPYLHGSRGLTSPIDAVPPPWMTYKEHRQFCDQPPLNTYIPAIAVVGSTVGEGSEGDKVDDKGLTPDRDDWRNETTAPAIL